MNCTQDFDVKSEAMQNVNKRMKEIKLLKANIGKRKTFKLLNRHFGRTDGRTQRKQHKVKQFPKVTFLEHQGRFSVLISLNKVMNPNTIKMERTRNPNQLIIRTDRQIDGQNDGHKEGKTDSRVRKDRHTGGQTDGQTD